jgi:hypothetical protein
MQTLELITKPWKNEWSGCLVHTLFQDTELDFPFAWVFLSMALQHLQSTWYSRHVCFKINEFKMLQRPCLLSTTVLLRSSPHRPT